MRGIPGSDKAGWRGVPPPRRMPVREGALCAPEPGSRALPSIPAGSAGRGQRPPDIGAESPAAGMPPGACFAVWLASRIGLSSAETDRRLRSSLFPPVRGRGDRRWRDASGYCSMPRNPLAMDVLVEDVLHASETEMAAAGIYRRVCAARVLRAAFAGGCDAVMRSKGSNSLAEGSLLGDDKSYAPIDRIAQRASWEALDACRLMRVLNRMSVWSLSYVLRGMRARAAAVWSRNGPSGFYAGIRASIREMMLSYKAGYLSDRNAVLEWRRGRERRAGVIRGRLRRSNLRCIDGWTEKSARERSFKVAGVWRPCRPEQDRERRKRNRRRFSERSKREKSGLRALMRKRSERVMGEIESDSCDAGRLFGRAFSGWTVYEMGRSRDPHSYPSEARWVRLYFPDGRLREALETVSKANCVKEKRGDGPLDGWLYVAPVMSLCQYAVSVARDRKEMSAERRTDTVRKCMYPVRHEDGYGPCLVCPSCRDLLRHLTFPFFFSDTEAPGKGNGDRAGNYGWGHVRAAVELSNESAGYYPCKSLVESARAMRGLKMDIPSKSELESMWRISGAVSMKAAMIGRPRRQIKGKAGHSASSVNTLNRLGSGKSGSSGTGGSVDSEGAGGAGGSGGSEDAGESGSKTS